jgi:hypothetical protein
MHSHHGFHNSPLSHGVSLCSVSQCICMVLSQAPLTAMQHPFAMVQRLCILGKIVRHFFFEAVETQFCLCTSASIIFFGVLSSGSVTHPHEHNGLSGNLFPLSHATTPFHISLLFVDCVDRVLGQGWRDVSVRSTLHT